MATSRKKTTMGGSEDVDALMRDLDHPLKAEIQAVRSLILDASPTITESVKWKAPSFAVSEHFATFNLRKSDGVQVILHLGAKVRDVGDGLTVDDPKGLLQWLAKDRASVTFPDQSAITASREFCQSLIRTWIKLLP